ncbi:MAG: hypothetical protein KAH67_06800 [Flavobacteriaceae bacterium]|nr:hypothetical protein [Flavobacteriaceae bacterium]
MQFHGLITQFPKEIKLLITVFVITLSIGFFTGVNFIRITSTFKSNGIESNYLGNEEDENVEVMQFKKSEKEILTLIHNHILSMSIIFLLLGGILSLTSMNKTLKKVLMFEPFVSIILTFGGIYVLWSGVFWFKYVVMLSGLAMVLSFIFSIIFILKETIFFIKKV